MRYTISPSVIKRVTSYSHLRVVFTDDDDTKAVLPAHIVLAASDFSKIKTNMPARSGKTGEPVAELTAF